MPIVRVRVMLKPSLLDSAGRTVLGSLHKLGFSEVDQARIGKVVELHLTEYDEDRVREMCAKLLTNPVIEDFEIEALP